MWLRNLQGCVTRGLRSLVTSLPEETEIEIQNAAAHVDETGGGLFYTSEIRIQNEPEFSEILRVPHSVAYSNLFYSTADKKIWAFKYLLLYTVDARHMHHKMVRQKLYRKSLC